MAATVGLAYLAHRATGLRTRVGVAVFGVSLVAMFTVSALYHSYPWTERVRLRMQRVDHSLIFLVVAGTLTPFALAALHGWKLVVALATAWSIAITGIAVKLLGRKPRVGLSITLQTVMGWTALIWLPWFIANLGWGAAWLILAGGACYTVGTIVFATKRPRLSPRLFSYHEVFHLLVVAGSSLHFWAVVRYVA